MSLKVWFMRLSTLSPLDSIDIGRSRRGSRPPVVLGDTMAATLMLVVEGDTAVWGTMLAAIGEGVFSCDEDG